MFNLEIKSTLDPYASKRYKQNNMTLLFCTSYSDSANNQEKRLKRWINFYLEKMDLLGVDYLFLIDDKSENLFFGDGINVMNVKNLSHILNKKVNIVQFEKHLGRPTQHEQLGWWRSFTYAIEIAKKYSFNKMIHIESDFFVVSKKMFDFIKGCSTGWVSLYSPFNKFPESAIQIICQDSFSAFNEIRLEAIRNNFQSEQIAEWKLPFTQVEKSFKGDRLGEKVAFDAWKRIFDKPVFLDFIGQIENGVLPKDFLPHFKFEFEWDN